MGPDWCRESGKLLWHVLAQLIRATSVIYGQGSKRLNNHEDCIWTPYPELVTSAACQVPDDCRSGFADAPYNDHRALVILSPQRSWDLRIGLEGNSITKVVFL